MFGLGSSNIINLGIQVTMRDLFSRKAGQVSQSLNAITGSAKATNQELNKAYGIMNRVGYAAIAMGTAITGAYASAVKAGAKYQDQMITIKAIAAASMDDQQKKQLPAMMKQLADLSVSMTKEFPFDRIELAESMKELVKAGVELKEIPDVLTSMANAAVAADEALGGKEGVAAKMIDMLNAWNMTAKQSPRMADLLTMTANLSTTDFGTLFETMKYSQSSFMAMKIPLEDALALMGSIGSAGLKGSMGGTTLGNMVRFLAKGLVGPTAKQAWALNQLGLSREQLEDSKTGVLDMVATVSLLSQKMKNMKPLDKKVIMESLFGERGSRIQPLIEKIIENNGTLGMTVGEFRDTLLGPKTEGVAERIRKERMKSHLQRVNILKNAWTDLKITVFEKIQPLLTRAVNMLILVIQKASDFVKTPFGGFLVQVGAALGPILLLTGGINLLVSALGRFAMLLPAAGIMKLAGKFAIFKTLANLFGGGAGGAAAGAGGGMLAGMASKFGPMWKAFKTAFSSGARKNSAGRWINSTTGRFVGMGGGAGPLVIGNVLGKVVPVVGTLTGALSLMGVTVEQQVGLLKTGLGGLAITLVNVGREIKSWFTGENFEFLKETGNLTSRLFNAMVPTGADAFHVEAPSAENIYGSKYKYTPPAAQAGDHITINIDGKKVADDTVKNLIRQFGNNTTLR